MKKLIALLLAVMMVLALCACGDTAEEPEATEEAVEEVAAEAEAPVAEAPVEEAAEAPEAPADGEEPPAKPEGEEGDKKAEGAPEGEGDKKDEGVPASDGTETGGAQAGNFVELSVNEVIPTAAKPETYTADEDGWKQYMLDCAYYAMGTSDSDNKLGSTYYDILNNNMTDMFVNMWGVDSMDAFIAAGGNPTVAPWTLAEGLGTPETVPDATEEAAAE